MRPGETSGIVRVTHSREQIEQATLVAEEKKREGYSPEAAVLAVDEVLDSMSLSRAIVAYVQTKTDEANVEKPASWLSLVMSLFIAGVCLFVIYTLFGMIRPSTEFFSALFVLIGQAILFWIFKRTMRYAVISATDALNNASFPTKLHPMRNANSALGLLRLQRLRALISQTADRLIAGEKGKTISVELQEVNLTPKATGVVVGLAKIQAFAREYLPPYSNRWLGLILALAFIVTCIIFIERAGDRVAEGYKNYAMAITGWLAGDLAARPRRRIRLPAEPPPPNL